MGMSTPLAALLVCLSVSLSGCGSVAQDDTRAGRSSLADTSADMTGSTAQDGIGDGPGSCAERAESVRRSLQSAAGALAFGPMADRPDVPYGQLNRQRLDVFLAKGRPRDSPAPVIVMVHGGGWCVGDKALGVVTRNKVEHWTPKGFIFVTVDYPMIPDGHNARQQATSIARAVAYVQAHASDWSGDPHRVILMGHSAGAHLVSLLNADARLRSTFGVGRILGTVSLDSGATNVPTQMRKAPPKLKSRYQEAFGTTESEWISASPFHQMDRSSAPWLGVCSTRRPDDSCGQAREYSAKAQALGAKASVLPVDLAHGSVNRELGRTGSYTSSVDQFLGSLDPLVKSLLSRS